MNKAKLLDQMTWYHNPKVVGFPWNNVSEDIKEDMLKTLKYIPVGEGYFFFYVQYILDNEVKLTIISK